MNIVKCLGCEFADVQDDNVKCMCGKKSYPEECPLEVSLDFFPEVS
jgi:hypothetical protein